MRILAVRGQNLASLAEPFAIDLDAEPLAGAGLFAITGETGAGKSTLLDAICLALYGRFPRISSLGADEEIPDVADGEALKARDARSILRRGAANGWAEVDFLGIDGGHYRARWSAYRARNRPGGRLQPAGRQIDRLGPDGDVVETVADQARSVEARIVDLTDLTFEQFRRTVLLAQGDFDAFLRADDRERADLLEKITGTEIYARLSARAFERAREAREALTLLESRRREVGLLDDDARRERQAQRRSAIERLERAKAGSEAARAALAAHDRIETAQARLAAAEAEVAAAEADRAGATPARERLERIDRAQRLRPAFTVLAEAEAGEAAAVAALAAVESQLADATPALEQARTVRDTAAAAVAVAEARIADLAPQWEAAARLDVRLEEARREAEAAEAPMRAAREARDAEGARLEAIDARRMALAAEVARLEHELTRLAALAPLAERWDDIEARLVERIATARELRRAGERRHAAEGRIAELAGRLAAHERDEAGDAERRGGIEVRIAERGAVLAALDETGLRRREARLAALQDDVAGSIPVAAARGAAIRDHTAAAREAAGAVATAETIGARRDEVERRQQVARARRDGLAAVAELATAITSAEAAHLRGRLVDGEPCPVCGARDHPVTRDPGIVAALERVRGERAAIEAEIGELDRLAADLDGERAALRARLAEAERRGTEATKRRADAELRLAAGTAAIAERAAEAGLAFDRELAVGDPEAALAALSTGLRRVRAETRATLDRIGVVRDEIDGLRLDLGRLDGEREARRAARRADESEAAAARSEMSAAAETESGARRRLVDLDERLTPRLAGLEIGPDDLDRDEGALVDHLARAVADHRAKAAAVARAGEEGKDLERTRLALREMAIRAEEAVIAAEVTVAARREVVDRLAAERAGLLGGAATASHRAAATDAWNAAAAARDGAEARLRAARSAHETALALHGERHTALIEAQDEVRHRAHARDRALAAADLDLAAATALLASPEEVVEGLRAEVAAAEDRATRAQVAAAERRRDLEAATAAGRPAETPAELREALAAARAEAETLNREIGALDQVLAADDAARSTAEGLDRAIAEARGRHDVAAAVDAAIGSRDGDKFRRFAQGITLDRLTDLANRHLTSLNPRYRLGRADGLGLTIVDRDMGEEVRSTRSLSGGERFLASLALALALSGLEGRRSFVDTLFVDEGFGSLDAATLDVAIDALEGLQSEGRKVGVISHVAAMHDRIPVQIRVEKAGAGRSRVRVVGAG